MERRSIEGLMEGKTQNIMRKEWNGDEMQLKKASNSRKIVNY